MIEDGLLPNCLQDEKGLCRRRYFPKMHQSVSWLPPGSAEWHVDRSFFLLCSDVLLNLQVVEIIRGEAIPTVQPVSIADMMS